MNDALRSSVWGMCFSLWFIPALVCAQRIVPALPQTHPVAVVGATVHVGDGSVIAQGAVYFDRGILQFVGPSDQLPPLPEQTQIIQAQGKHVYPALIAANTQLGLNEIEMVRATHDYAEVGKYTPCVRSLIAYNTDSKVIPTVRSNGILFAQIVPIGGLLTGTSSVVQLDAWNWEDAAYQSDNGIHVRWPSYLQYYWDDHGGRLRVSAQYEQEVQELENYFQSAFAYLAMTKRTERNLNFEALDGLRTGKKILFIHCDYIREIIHAVQWASKLNLTPVLVGGRDAWMCTDLLKEKNIAVVLTDPHSLPPYEDSDLELPYRTAAKLHEAGVLYAISVSGFWQVRNLPFMAGTTVAYGVPYEQAIASISLHPAKILGIAHRTGSLHAGKDANLLISAGDILDMKTCQVEHAFIQGRAVNLDNFQKQLYQIYREKYQLH